ncbi:fructose PTS transporter subunit IIA [Collinsella sp. AGMB00827]|uniref:Fructose PTS transporter subunit IIA n=1 Tax=Collinsella ureilytica TaxID=2869515 RepID=A0ABS7MJK6_9ACTN|nr:fructose PTS transporter subunit IIA [Collinsella urealyticum]MBY4797213.1 fructose PTS transporter subunit IIA [Collinsella urealyticum]
MELMTPDLVLFDLQATSKEDVIRALAHAMDASNRLSDLEAYVADVFAREAMGTTALGFRVATPHAKSEAVSVASLGFAHLAHPIDWDGEQVDLVFQIAVPLAEAGDRHLVILAQLARQLIHADFRERLASTSAPAEVVDLVGIA